MKRLIAVPVALAVSAAWSAPQSPSMHFLALAATQAPGSISSQLMQSRHRDRMVVVVKEPAACGQRLSAPSFAVDEGVLHLGYRRPAASAQQSCVATGIFTLKGLPQRPLTVAADAVHAGFGTLADNRGPSAGEADAQRSQAGPRLAMKFIGGQAKRVTGTVQRSVRQMRKGDQMVAVVTQPVACGTRLIEPSVALDEHALALRYGMTESAGGAMCAATGVFSVKGLPAGKWVAVAQGHAVSVARTSQPSRPESNGPRMSFIGTPALMQAAGGRGSVQVRNGDALNLVLHEPAPCGERLQAAAFKLEGRRLSVHYQVPGTQASEAKCIATAMIVFRGLPAQDIRVVAVSDTVPAQRLALARPSVKLD